MARPSSVATTCDDAAVTAPVYGRSRFRVGDPLPAVIYLPDVAAVLDVQMSRAYDLQRTNELRQFELRPRIGGRPRYSGPKIQRWLDGESMVEEPRYFRSARG
jgi:hypothetical protein